jgi:hypothetical protein
MFDETRFQVLVAAFFDQQLGPEEKGELEGMLLSSSRARQLYLDQAEWNGLTREWALRGHSLETTAAFEPKVRPRVSFWKWGVGIAACFIAIGAFNHFRNKEGAEDQTAFRVPVEEGQDVAMIGQSTGVVWEPGEKALVPGSPLTKGWLRIREGTLRLDFYSGARVILQGPASIELLSPDLARLDKGTLRVVVPTPARGFTLLNGDFRAVDRGSEFGMRADNPGRFDVHVFRGELELAGGTTFPQRRLHEGEALAVRSDSLTPFPADSQAFMDPATLYQVNIRETKALREAWGESSAIFRSTPDLLVYYDFDDLDPASPGIPNRAMGSKDETSATIIGCERLSGRLKDNSSLGFTKTSDRVRFRLSGKKTSLTMMAWVRVDSLKLDHNSLLSMAADEVGEVHWKLDRSGKLLLGLRASAALDYGSWERLESPKVVTERDFGRWIHFASVIDGDEGTMKHYINGEEVASGRIRRATPVQLGLANLGNFDPASQERAKFGTGRSFNGRIDEFALIGRSMKPEEIRKAAK